MNPASSNGSDAATGCGNPALARVKIIRDSLGCFWLGWLGLVPGLGLPFACLAWVRSNQALREQQFTWNPAERYRVAGVVLARIGVILTLLGIGVGVLGVSLAAW